MATEQLALTQPQDATRVFVLRRSEHWFRVGAHHCRSLSLSQSDDVVIAVGDVQAILAEEAAPVVEALCAVEG